MKLFFIDLMFCLPYIYSIISNNQTNHLFDLNKIKYDYINT